MVAFNKTISSEDVLNALRLWNGGSNVDEWPLVNLRVKVDSDQKEEFSSLADSGPAAYNRVLLNEGLKVLATISPEAETLLRERFEHQRDVLAVAYSLNIAESSLYYRQRQAINKLTEILIELDQAANAEWQARMKTRLPMPSYTQLVGVEEASEIITNSLLDRDAHFIVSIDGLGGIGKTAIAHQVTHNLLQTTRFNEICWVTAKQTHLTTLGRLQIESGRPALTFPMLIEALSEQLNVDNLEEMPQIQRQQWVKTFLRQQPCLVIIDNLETIADYRDLLPSLQAWGEPSKFLLTSRHRLLNEPMVFSYSLKELPAKAAYTLIRMEAQRTGFSELANAPQDTLQRIYAAVGGNPLALKLIVGQARFYSLTQVLERFTETNNKQLHETVFDYIYLEIWEKLSDTNKGALLALTQAGTTGFDFAHLQAVTSLPNEVLLRSLEELILLSLIDLAGSLDARRYRLHRLTEIFLLKMFT